MDGSLSEPRHVSIGLPQGSILSPLLYTIFPNDLPECVHSHDLPDQKHPWFNLSCIKCGSICCFADDSSFNISAHDPVELNGLINRKYDNIANYMHGNKLSLNSDKTDIMIIQSR